MEQRHPSDINTAGPGSSPGPAPVPLVGKREKSSRVAAHLASEALLDTIVLLLAKRVADELSAEDAGEQE